MQGRLVDNAKIIYVSAPADYNTSAATSEFICMKNYQRVCFIIQTGAWAGGTAAVTLSQATSDGGTTASLGFSYMWTNDGATTTDTLTKTAVTSNTFNLDTASSLYVIEVTSDMLDVDNGYDWVLLEIAAASDDNTDLYSVVAIAYEGRHSASGLKSAIA
jgi:hypothetical protein